MIMSWWKAFLDSLDSSGGHLFILIILFYSGIAFYHFLDSTGGGQVMNLFFGALMGYLTGKKLNS